MAKLYGVGTDNEKSVSERLKTEREAAEKKQKRTELIVAGVLVLVGIVVVVSNIISSGELDTKADALRVDAAGVEAELAKLNETPDASVSNEEVQTIQADLYSAKVAGERVCEIQNECSTAGHTQTELDEMMVELRTYIPDSNNSRVRQPWFRIYSGDDCVSGPQWSFDSTYDFANTNIPVVFRCYDSTGKYTDYPLAFVIGTYNAETNTFVDCSYIETAYGSWYFRQMTPEEIDMDPEETTESTDTTESTEPTESTGFVDGIINDATDPQEIDDDGSEEVTGTSAYIPGPDGEIEVTTNPTETAEVTNNG